MNNGRGEDAKASRIAAVNRTVVPGAKARCATFMQFSLYICASKLGPDDNTAALKLGFNDGTFTSGSEQY